MYYLNYILLLFVIGGILIINKRATINKVVAIAGAILCVLLLIYSKLGDTLNISYANFLIPIIRINYLGYIFALAFAIVLSLGVIFAIAVSEVRYSRLKLARKADELKTEKSITLQSGVAYGMHHKAVNYKELGLAFIYGGSAIATTFTPNLFIILVLWELLAIAAIFIILQNSKNYDLSMRAAKIYAIMHMLSGILLMIGIVFLVQKFSIIEAINLINLPSFYKYLILSGIVINLAFPPFSLWLISGYAAATPIGSIFLSAFTTKVAIFLLLQTFSGDVSLVVIGGIIAIYGIIFSVLTMNVRKILSYALIQQLGLMIIVLSLNTQTLHIGVTINAFSHILYKSLLFLLIGIAIYKAKTETLNKMVGVFYKNYFLGFAFIIVALNSFGFPLTAGFVAKSLISSQIKSFSTINYLDYFIMFISAANALNIGIRLPYLLCFKKPQLPFSEFKLSPTIISSIFLFLIAIQGVVVLVGIVTQNLIFNSYYVLHALQTVGLALIIFAVLFKLLTKFKVEIAPFKNLTFNYKVDPILEVPNNLPKTQSSIQPKIITKIESISKQLGPVAVSFLVILIFFGVVLSILII